MGSLCHRGILIGDLDAAAAFYGGILGCREVWRGNGPDSKTLNWVNMQVPDGENHVEFMLYGKLPPVVQWAVGCFAGESPHTYSLLMSNGMNRGLG